MIWSERDKLLLYLLLKDSVAYAALDKAVDQVLKVEADLNAYNRGQIVLAHGPKYNSKNVETLAKRLLFKLHGRDRHR